MKGYKKTLFGSITAFIIGTSCCWLTSLAIWVGGATFLGGIAVFVGETHLYIVGLGILLLIISLFLYIRNRE